MSETQKVIIETLESNLRTAAKAYADLKSENERLKLELDGWTTIKKGDKIESEENDNAS